MSKVKAPVYKSIDASKRGKALKHLTNNGRNKRMAHQLHKLMSNEETLQILNALFEVTYE